MESHWENKNINLGKVKINTTHKVEFKAKEGIPIVATIVPSCQCTNAKYNPNTRVLSIIYKSGAIPAQVVGGQTINKTIHVFYEGGGQELLSITGVKIR